MKRSMLKRSRFLRLLRQMKRALVRDVRALQWTLARRRPIERYLAQPGPKALHIGAGTSNLSGWLNTDITAKRNGILYLDATAPFPFPDRSFDYIFSEHMIEHVPYNDAVQMLSECHRILKPGGRVRIATPDLGVLLGLHPQPDKPEQRHYVDWIIKQCLPNATHNHATFVINNAFRAWGHQFLYDRDTLQTALEQAGFTELRPFKPGESDDEWLRNLESHGREIGDESINQFETQVWEAATLKAQDTRS